MAKSWTNLETHVRSLASYIWDRTAEPRRIGGVDVDCVLEISLDRFILIEITEERDLQKVREDVIKLSTARGALFASDNIYAQCYCVVGASSITPSMRDAGASQKVRVTSLSNFEREFFDFRSYNTARLRRQFGSAVDPITGKSDEIEYTPVTYKRDAVDLTIHDICELLLRGRKIILVGEYGSGKSRCARETFIELSNRVEETGFYPISVDLRDNWGLKRASEIVDRHFIDLGLDESATRVRKTLNSPMFIFILDGFDELGFQAWSSESDKLKSTRFSSLQGVRDILRILPGGVLISGREHYFDNNADMLAALGVNASIATIIKSKEEFSNTEMAAYLTNSGVDDVETPDWLPRRPLICRAIASLAESDRQRMFEIEGGDIEFWHAFVDYLCRRDADINPAFDAASIKRILVNLARVTRVKTPNTGPISLSEIQKAFEIAIGEAPDAQAAVMLQRLPGLGRVKAETEDRQFLDIFILDGLRALDVNNVLATGGQEVENSKWTNPLDRLGQRVLAKLMVDEKSIGSFLRIANRCSSLSNKVLAGDVISTILRTGDKEYDFRGLALADSHLADFDMSGGTPVNLRVLDSVFGTLILAGVVPRGTVFERCVAERIIGVGGIGGLPTWADVLADKFDTPENVAAIRRSALSPQQKVLVTVLKKTFFQKGSGRKEEALLRGLGNITTARTVDRIVNILIREDILTKFRGDEGDVYAPNRVNTTRVGLLLDELNVSKDPIWHEVSNL
jgi:hypothetical protein